MDTQDLVTGIRWELLKFIAMQPRTGGDLAKETNTSPANVSQHLKLLELAGLVVKERVNGKSAHYKLAKETALITILSGRPYRDAIILDDFTSLELRLFLDKKPRAKYLRRLIIQHEDLVRNFIAFGTIKEEGDIQLLVLANDVKPLRKEYANIPIGDKKIIIWSHTPAEVKEGLKNKEQYFLDMFKNLTILYDPAKALRSIKEEYA